MNGDKATSHGKTSVLEPRSEEAPRGAESRRGDADLAFDAVRHFTVAPDRRDRMRLRGPVLSFEKIGGQFDRAWLARGLENGPASRVASILTLEPGDVIACGSPAGVGAGREPQVFLQKGDVVVATIDGIGSLTHRVE